MALQSKTTLFIGGFQVPVFKRIMLHQQIDSHHMLEVVCRMDVLETLSDSLGEQSKNFLGETITLQINSLDTFSGYKELEFKGVVTQIKNVKGFNHTTGDEIIIKAQSPNYLADDGAHYASYIDTTLSEIVNSSIQGYDQSKLEVAIQPKNDATLHYSVQHDESSYDYISRLASQYGEWFYYDGKKLIFGKPGTEELSLTYSFDLKEYHLELMPQSHNYKYFTNDYLSDQTHEKTTQGITSGVNGYSGFVSNKANTIFSKETKIWNPIYNDPKSKQRMDSGVEAQKKAIEIKQVKLVGVSDNPGVSIGNIVKVEGGSYRVTNITHTNNENGDYQNRFEAITAEFDAYPNTNINTYPKSQSQSAVVKDNNDPDGLGRIKVEFPWQKPIGEMTPWIRIVTPHAGGDKGFHFIPEVGEEVLIGFEGGNAERPYMMGSLYHGSAKPDSWKTAANDVKAIRTRSGHTIELNDTSGGEFITITDKNKNLITIDTANNNMTITALENMTFNAKNVQMNVAETYEINVGQDKVESVGKNHIINSGNSIETVAQSKSVNVTALYNQYSATANLIATSGDMTIHSKGVSTLQGNGDVKISKG